MKLVNEVPRSTHTYFVEHLLAADFTPVKTELFARFSKFFKTLQKSVSHEVRFLANLVKNDIMSVTGRNLVRIQSEIGLNPHKVTAKTIRMNPVKLPVPSQDEWRLPVLERWLVDRRQKDELCEDTKHIQLLIDSLCET